mgnify:CR=1 FL=1
MPSVQANSALKKMTRKSENQNSGGVPRALKRSIIQAAETLFHLKLAVASEQKTLISLSGFLSSAENGNLILVLEGQDGRRGACLLSLEFIQSIVEMSTLGQVSSKPVADRQMTRTDAALVEPFIDAFLTRLEQGKSLGSDVNLVQGYRFGASAQDYHNLGNLLDETEYSVFSLKFTPLGDRSGMRLTLALPVECKKPDNNDALGDIEAWSSDLSKVVRSAKLDVQVVAQSLRLPFDFVRSLSIGQVIPLEKQSFTDVKMISGKMQIARGKLGQVNGVRAIKIKSVGEIGPIYSKASEKELAAIGREPEQTPQLLASET